MIRTGWHILWVTLAIVSASLLLLKSFGVDPRLSSYLLNFQLYILSTCLVLGLHLLLLLWRERPDRPIGYTANLISKKRDKALQALPLLLAVAVFMPTFSAMKSAIPLFNDYRWDNVFIAWDIALHGRDPWLLLQPILGFPIITAILAVMYHVWVLLIYLGSVYFALYVSNRDLVLRYFLSFILTWSLLGMALATYLASVGPVFLDPIVGDSRFVQHVAYLEAANRVFPILVLPVQEQLLAGYQDGLHGLGRGITAMPSMHVALAFLFWLAARQISRVFGWIMFGFLTIILIGSVHLAYHYAVDGYVSIGLTFLIWKFAGALTSRRNDEVRSADTRTSEVSACKADPSSS